MPPFLESGLAGKGDAETRAAGEAGGDAEDGDDKGLGDSCRIDAQAEDSGWKRGLGL